MDPFEYFRNQLKASGKSDSEIETALNGLRAQVTANPALLETMQQTVRRATSDFDSMKGRVDAISKENQELKDWHPKAVQQFEETKRNYEEAQQTLKETRERLEAAYQAKLKGGNPDPDSTPDTTGGNVDTSKFLTRDDFIAAENERNERYSKAIVGMSAVSSDHMAQYGKPLDVNKFVAYMGEKKSNDIVSAYSEFTAEQRKAKEEKERDAEIERRVAERLRDANSRSSVPGAVNTSSPIHQQRNTEGVPENPKDHLASIWAESYI